MSLYKRQRSEFWYANIFRSGRPRLRCSTGEREKAKAQRVHDELAARVWHEKQTGKPLETALAAWVKARKRSVHELNQVEQINTALPRLPLTQATEAAFMEAFGDKKPATYNRLANIYRSALKLAKRAGWIGSAPEIQRRKVEPYDPRYLTGKEWDNLYHELPAHLKPMAAFAVSTGLRWSNVARLTWDRVDINRKIAWIPASKAKGRKPISIPLSQAAIQALRSTQGHRKGFVFTYDGEPIGSAKTAFLAAVRRAGLEGFRWHDFRHTWASWHVMAGTSPAVLQELGGWSSPDMVRRYAHLAPGHTAAYADNARPPMVRGSKAA